MANLTEHPKVSVCIPCRNGVRELPHTLENLLGKSEYPKERFEVLVGDHGSNDGTSEWLQARSREMPMLRRIPVEYDGPNRAKVRNALLRKASGDILIFIDHDVLASRSFIGAHVAAHQKFPGALVAGKTYGKGAFRREIDHLLAQLELTDISASVHLLEGSADLGDLRTRDLPDLGQEPDDIRNQVCPTRFFWTCNVSMARTDLEACGGYDENYRGWGLEDDDCACAFNLRNRPLVFSNQAWGFHIPHAADSKAQMLSWRRNFDYLLSKFPSRELEYFYLAPFAVARVGEQLDWSIRLASEIDVTELVGELSVALSKPSARRLGLFLLDRAVAERLMVSDAFIPTLPLNAQASTVAGIRVWPLLGTKTPFGSKTFDESVLIADQLLMLDDVALGLLLLEATRISKHVIVGAGRHCLAEGSAFASKKFFEKLATVKFDKLSVVGAAQALSVASV